MKEFKIKLSTVCGRILHRQQMRRGSYENTSYQQDIHIESSKGLKKYKFSFVT